MAGYALVTLRIVMEGVRVIHDRGKRRHCYGVTSRDSCSRFSGTNADHMSLATLPRHSCGFLCAVSDKMKIDGAANLPIDNNVEKTISINLDVS